MKHKSRFLLSVLSGLAMSSAFTSPAFAQKGMSFSNSSTWEIADVAGSNLAGPAYCVLSRSFDGRVSLNFAKNVEKEASVAVNFSEDVLADIGTVDHIVLDPGAGQQRVLDVSQIENTAFLAKIGKDSSFFDALAHTGFLRVGLADKSFNFDLADFDGAQSRLDMCLTALDQTPTQPLIALPNIDDPQFIAKDGDALEVAAETVEKLSGEGDASYEPVVEAKAPAPVEQKAAVQEPVVKAEAASSIAEAPTPLVVKEAPPPAPSPELLALQSKYEELQDTQADLKFEIGMMRDAMASKESMAEALRGDIERLRADNATLRDELTAQKASVPVPSVSPQENLSAVSVPAVEQVDFLNQRVQELTAELAAKTVESGKVSELSSAVEKLTAENEALKAQGGGDTAYQQESEALRQQLALAEQQKTDLMQKIASLETDKQKLEAEKQSLMASMSAGDKGAEFAVLQKERDALNAENERLASRLALAKKAGDVLLQRFNQQRAMNQSLQQELKLAMNPSQGKSAGSADLLVAQIEALEIANNRLKEENKALSAQSPAHQQVAAALKGAEVDTSRPAELAQESVQLQKALDDVKQASRQDSGFDDAMMDMAGLNEAQRMEKSMAMADDSAGEVVQSVRATEDPFADIPIEDNFKGYSYDSAAAETDAMEEPEEESFGFVRHANKKKDKPKAAVAREMVSAAPASAQAMPKSAPMMEKEIAPPQPVQSSAATIKADVGIIQSLLNRSGVSLSAPVELVEDGSGGVTAYQWAVGDVYGSAEQQPLMNVYQFDEKVKEYLLRTEARCPGDFAVVPADTVDIGDMRVDSYDVACMGDNLDATASLLFFNKDGTFSAVAHEAAAVKMDTAMDVRDRLAKSVEGGA